MKVIRVAGMNFGRDELDIVVGHFEIVVVVNVMTQLGLDFLKIKSLDDLFSVLAKESVAIVQLLEPAY